MTATQVSDLEAQLSQLQAEAQSAIGEAPDLDAIEQLRVAFLGKKGKISAVLGGMGKLPAEDRPRIGAKANEVKDAVQAILDRRRTDLQADAIRARLDAETLDVTAPGTYRPLGRKHPLASTIDRVLDICVGLGYTVADGPEMETDYYNFEALNTPADHPARDMADTFYLPDGNLLRTHTSSVQLRYMEEREPPIRVVAPGRVYRRDQVDATHAAVFHQIELLAIDQGLTFTDMKGTIETFLGEIFGEVEVRFRASYFPFTEPSAEVDVKWKGRWLEVLGCGMVDPNVMKSAGLDPEVYSGFAAGFGVERFAMVLHQIDDIRRVYASDLRFLRQF
ncbi:MAG TPA: phenylalanine--tRNA ligase subunit alpha [Coleofasciculaceae cyanobacterium]